jgi:hemolysin activation/secretion protein
LTLEEIEAAAAAVTSVYHKQGFILAQAYLPQQNASSGDLTIAVVVGRYGEVTIKNESRLRNGVVSSAFSKMGPAGAPVKNDDVEKVTLALSQLPGGVRPKLTVSAGKEFGTTDFLAEVGYGKLVDGYALVDNQGSKYTGRWRLGAGINFNSPLGLGDRLSFNGMVSQEGSGLLSGRLAYSIPLGVYGPTFTVAVSRTTYELGKQYADLDPVGRSDSLYLGLAYPILRSRNHNLYLSASTTFKDIRDELRVDNLAWNKSATVGALGIGYDGWFHAFGGRDLFLSAEVFLALGRLKAPDQADYQAAGTFSRANATLSASLRLTNTLSALLTLQGQKILNGQRLDGSEQIIISGPSGVRAYLEPVSGDNGWTAELELRCNLPSIGRLNHSLGVFAATGRAWNRNPLSDLDYGVKLSNVGLGYRANFEPFFVSVHVASAVGHWPENYQKEDRTQVVGQFGLLF